MSYALARFGGFGAMGLGAISFLADEVWSNWVAGGASANLAADSIRAALSQIGYGPFQMGVAWGSGTDKAEYGRAVDEQGIPATPGMPKWWPNKGAMIKLEELVKAGDNVGGGPVTEYHIVDNKVVSGKSPAQIAAEKKAVASNKNAGLSTAGMTTGAWVGIGVAALAVVGGLALLAKKKKDQRRQTPSAQRSSSEPATVAMAANYRRHRRY